MMKAMVSIVRSLDGPERDGRESMIVSWVGTELLEAQPYHHIINKQFINDTTFMNHSKPEPSHRTLSCYSLGTNIKMIQMFVFWLTFWCNECLIESCLLTLVLTSIIIPSKTLSLLIINVKQQRWFLSWVQSPRRTKSRTSDYHLAHFLEINSRHFSTR